MANTTTNKTTKTNDVEENKTENKKIIPRDVDTSQIIIVRNGFQGRLVYISSKTGEKYIWDEFGEEQEMELKELRNAKSSAKTFFIKNWFMFDEDWIVDYLGMRQYYKNAVSIEEFDDLFKRSPYELKKIISEMSSGQKKSVKYRAIELIASKEIDSLKTIDALEDALGIDLIEK